MPDSPAKGGPDSRIHRNLHAAGSYAVRALSAIYRHVLCPPGRVLNRAWSHMRSFVRNLGVGIQNWFTNQPENLDWSCGPEFYPVRFLITFLACALISHSFTISLCISVPKEHLQRYFTHSLTYSLIHGTAFSAAIAVFATTLNRAYFTWVNQIWRYLIPLVALAIIGLAWFIKVVVVDDAEGNTVEPYMLVREVAVEPTPAAKPVSVHDYNSLLHSEFDSLRSEPKEQRSAKTKDDWEAYDKEVAKYKLGLQPYLPLVKPYKDRNEAQRRKINMVYSVSVFLTWFFTLFIVGLYVPVIGIMGTFKFFGLRRIEQRLNAGYDERLNAEAVEKRAYYKSLWNNYFVIYLLIVTWLPFRVYATYYQRAMFMGEDLTNQQVAQGTGAAVLKYGFTWITAYFSFWRLFVLAILFLGILLLLKYGRSALPWLAAFASAFVAVVGVIAQFNDNVRLFLYEVIENNLNAPLVYFMILYFAMTIAGLFFALVGTSDLFDP